MKTINLILLASAFLWPAIITSAQENEDFKLAKSYFREMDSLSSSDNGKLWGVKLYGPTMFVQPDTRLIIANQPDKNKTLTAKDGIYTGTLPENVNISNTSLTWNGTNWTMVMWNALPQEDKYLRDKLLLHESWHRIQNEIGITPISSANAYLDELQGSILIKFELMALKQSLMSKDTTEKKKYLEDALIIRKYRQALFPVNNENEFERHEGVAEYTGYKLCGIDNRFIQKVVAKQLEFAINKDGFANSFAYLTGPAYGFLLDELHQDWIKEVLHGKNMAAIAFATINNKNIPSDTVQLKSLVTEITKSYKADSLVKNETEKFEQQKKLITEYRQKIMEGDQLIIPNNNVNISYNPQEKMIQINNLGVVYKTARLTGEWGILEVNDGIYRTNDWQVFIIPAPKSMDSGTIKEVGYDLTLNKGWKIIKIKEGKYTFKKERL